MHVKHIMHKQNAYIKSLILSFLDFGDYHLGLKSSTLENTIVNL